MQNLLDELKNLLATQPRFTQEGRMIKQAVIDAAQSLDGELLRLLMSHDAIKRHFFQEVDGVMVFDKVKLLRFVSNKAFLEDSYTAFKNKIGLATKNTDGTYDAYLSDSKEVVLAYPYKDCMLEGGQTKEDQKRNEIFWNETLAPDDIDRLTTPKAFSKVRRYDANGVQENVTDLSLQDNYIIKGNNLLALYSLLPVYRGKVKLIYIDPPYNTGSDSFGYNDSFNRSTWLTFMKNRIEVAKKLLSPSGIFLVQCSFHQFSYLKVLMNEIFEKHLCDFNIQVRHPDRTLTGDKEYNDIIEYILIYSNDPFKKMPVISEEKTVDDYILKIKTKENVVPTSIFCGDKEVEVFLPDQYEVIVAPPSKEGLKKISIRGSIREKNSSGRFFVRFLEALEGFPPETLFKVPNMGDDAESHRYFYSAPLRKKNGGYYQGMPTSSSVTKKQFPNFFNFEKEYNNVAKQGGVEFRNGKKPEELMKFLLELFTNDDDIVLDFHLGSGTTAAVCHKMDRKYIGLEQMQHQVNLSIQRLESVINGDPTGVSRYEDIHWQGGGSFTYLELANANEHFVDEIQSAETEAELLEIWQRMQSEAFISYRIDLDKQSEYFGKEYEALSIDDKKRFLIEALDKNMLYVPYCDMESREFGMSEADKAATRAFYNLKNEA